MQRTTKYILMSFALLLASCQELPRYFSGEQLLAKVGDKELVADELRRSLPGGLSEVDSAAYAHVYIDRWVRRQLKLQEAEQLFSSSVEDIDRQVEEYRQSLLIRKLDQFYVDRQVDTTFTEQEISTYYNVHKSDFKLDRPIVRGCVVRVPKGYRQRARLKELMTSKQEARQQDFRDICLKQEFKLDDWSRRWIDWSDFLNFLPTFRSQNYDALMQKQGVQEMADKEFYYYFVIEQVLRAGDATPLEEVRQTIRRILFNGRQQQIIRDHEEQLYQTSLETRAIRFYGDAAEESQTQKPE
ncbi:MAG: hypothetical protein Q4A18_06575 [Rikenellaceae bacterium]|nr:hypothetical protein [Rikenellaceae bacterium]